MIKGELLRTSNYLEKDFLLLSDENIGFTSKSTLEKYAF